MKVLLLIVVLLAAGCVALLAAGCDTYAQPPVQPKQSSGIGKHRDNDNRPPRFKQALKHPPKQQPPHKRGGSWHWHPYQGWAWFPVRIAPRAVILPEAYVLPQQVTVYPQRHYVVCPRCGETIMVEVQ